MAGKNRPYSAQGYLVKEFLGGKDGKLYDFIDDDSIPEIIGSDLRAIQSEWGHGTSVVIPAFNFFGNAKGVSLWDIVARVSAYNFNVAILSGSLVVEVDDLLSNSNANDNCVRRLDRYNLGDVLEQYKDSVRSARRGSFFDGLRPSGENAYAAYVTQMEGDLHFVDTEDGIVSIRLLTSSGLGSASVDLFRNGMWITDSIVGLRRADFSNRQPFHAVLMLDANEGKELHRLIRKAEGPMHDELAFKRLSSPENDRLKVAVRKISQKIKDEIPEVGSDSFTPDDYLSVEIAGNGVGSGKSQFSIWGTPVVVQRARTSQRLFSPSGGGGTTTHEKDGFGKGTGRGERDSRSRRGNQSRRSRPLPFRTTSVPEGEGKTLISLEPTQSFDVVLLSIRIDENTDATCDRVWPDEDMKIKTFRITSDGDKMPSCKLVPDGRSIRICEMSAGAKYELELEYNVPQELRSAVGAPVFRVDLQRPIPEKDGTESDVHDN